MSKFNSPGSDVWGPRNLSAVRFKRKSEWTILYAVFAIVAALAALYLLVGCQSLPANQYSYKVRDPQTGRVLKEGIVETPNDTTIKGAKIVTANGTTIEIAELASKNNPDVISKQGKRERDNLDGVGNLVENVGDAVGSVGGSLVRKAAGAP